MLSLILPFRQGKYLFIQTECVSSHWDALRFAKAYEKNTRMCQNELNPESLLSNFRGFSSFRELGNAANGIFYSSQYWESRFSAFFDFPRGGKPLFLVFRSSYPYESLLLPFFVHRTPTKASFCRFPFIVPRIWTIFLENWWFTPVAWQIFSKIDDLLP